MHKLCLQLIKRNLVLLNCSLFKILLSACIFEMAWSRAFQNILSFFGHFLQTLFLFNWILQKKSFFLQIRKVEYIRAFQWCIIWTSKMRFRGGKGGIAPPPSASWFLNTPAGIRLNGRGYLEIISTVSLGQWS